MMDETQLRERFCQAVRQLWTRGMLVGADGLLSCEVHRRRYLVTPMGRRRIDLEPRDLICVDIGGENVRGGEGIPLEVWAPHRDAYQTHLDPAGVVLGASAVIEPANVLALLYRHDGSDSLNIGPTGPIPVLDGRDDRAMRDILSESTEVILKGRGLFVAAANLSALMNRIERLDLAAAVRLAANRD